MVFAPLTFQGPILDGNPTKQRSVVSMPARDEEGAIELTVRSMLAQTPAPLRWIAVHYCSTDRTRELIEKHLGAGPRMEIMDRRNRGLRARGGSLRHLRDYLEVISRREAA
jgi:hypothetical protein